MERGVAFREAHRVVGRLVVEAERSGTRLRDFTLAELKRFSPRFDRRCLTLWDPRRSVERKRSVGGTSPAQVRAALRRWRIRLGKG